ncbi:MAG: hypothetical protein P794_05060 [Epsilonproteobacteria bacterium (ex Lamellibrachia satsuma)]|nr:MAG: hypothetical protein P794_05060 [Epsilonproteobacteria bacterium (ex Lamellibrachia satsuma)]
MSYNYGLTSTDLAAVKLKLSKQKNYLEQNKFLGGDGKEKSLLDVSYSANLSKRYYPRILNKVNTFVSHAFEYDLVPVFLTITLDGFFRDFMKGNYSKWRKVRNSYLKHIPNNDRSGFYLDYIDKMSNLKKDNALTPKDLYKIIGHQMHRFTKSTTLQKVRKLGYTYSMIRVTESHKNGVPHFHVLVHLPKQFIPALYLEFKKYFPAPRDHKVIKDRTPQKIFDDNYETYGFQTEIRNAASYVLKYVLKSFVNLIEDKEVDYLQAWYVHNRIPRIITTHTLVSQDVYHKVAILDDDWHYLSNIKINAYFERDIENNTFLFDDGKDRKIIGDNGLVMIVNKGKILASYGSKEYRLKKIRLRSLSFTDKKPVNYTMLYQYDFYRPPLPYSYYISKSYSDGTVFVLCSPDDFYIEFIDNTLDDLDLLALDSLSDNFISVSKMSDFQLYDHYLNFDFDVFNPARYAIVNNELIVRGLLNHIYLNPNLYISHSSYFSVIKPANFNYLSHTKPLYPSYSISSTVPKTKIRHMSDEVLQKEFYELKFDYQIEYALLMNEMKKRNLL